MQKNFSNLEDAAKKKLTRRDRFLVFEDQQISTRPATDQSNRLSRCP
jgi:hypothetical protein